MKNIKLYGAFHKEYEKPLGSEWLLPIAVGKDAPNISGCDLRDSDGTNISHLNPFYCELTAQYWVRHNRPSAYVGFYHYRRYFSFINVGDGGQNYSIQQDASIFHFLSSNTQYERLANLLDIYDVVIPCSPRMQVSVEEQYVSCVDRVPWDVFMRVLAIEFPKYSRYVDYFRLSCQCPFWNMFVMPWEQFCNYCDELFIIIDKVSNIIGFDRDGYEGRYPGFLAERFLGFYLLVNRLTSCQVQMLMLNEPIKKQQDL